MNSRGCPETSGLTKSYVCILKDYWGIAFHAVCFGKNIVGWTPGNEKIDQAVCIHLQKPEPSNDIYHVARSSSTRCKDSFNRSSTSDLVLLNVSLFIPFFWKWNVEFRLSTSTSKPSPATAEEASHRAFITLDQVLTIDLFPRCHGGFLVWSEKNILPVLDWTSRWWWIRIPNNDSILRCLSSATFCNKYCRWSWTAFTWFEHFGGSHWRHLRWREKYGQCFRFLWSFDPASLVCSAQNPPRRLQRARDMEELESHLKSKRFNRRVESNNQKDGDWCRRSWWWFWRWRGESYLEGVGGWNSSPQTADHLNRCQLHSGCSNVDAEKVTRNSTNSHQLKNLFLISKTFLTTAEWKINHLHVCVKKNKSFLVRVCCCKVSVRSIREVSILQVILGVNFLWSAKWWSST